MFSNLTPDEATVAAIIQVKQSFDDAINQFYIAEEYMNRTKEWITPRRVRRIIEKLIEKGLPVISTPHQPNPGYCWYTYDSERVECINRLRRKAAKIFIRALRINRNCMAVRDKREKIEQEELF